VCMCVRVCEHRRFARRQRGGLQRRGMQSARPAGHDWHRADPPTTGHHPLRSTPPHSPPPAAPRAPRSCRRAPPAGWPR
jgi:hypothetical protein